MQLPDGRISRRKYNATIPEMHSVLIGAFTNHPTVLEGLVEESKVLGRIVVIDRWMWWFGGG